MKILGRRIIKGVGFLRLVPTDEDDFWYLYNLLAVGDIIRTTTHRKIVRECINLLRDSINWQQDI